MKAFHLLVPLSLALIYAVPAQAQVIWDGDGGDNLWSTAANWDTNSVPTGSDVAQVPSGPFTIDIESDVTAQYFSNANTSGELVTLNINSGSLTETANTFGLRFLDGSNTVINVAGGTLDGGLDVYGPTTSGTVTYNITSGLLTGYDRFRYDSVSVNLSGGRLDMGGETGPSNLSFQNNAALSMSGTGGFVFDVFGNGSNDSVAGSSAVDFSGGLIEFRFDDAYTPQAGDTYDFLGTGMTVDGTGSNISTMDIEGKYSIVWDTSQWGVGSTGTDPSKGVLTIVSVTAIPEPANLPVVGGLFLLAISLLRRRRQA